MTATHPDGTPCPDPDYSRPASGPCPLIGTGVHADMPLLDQAIGEPVPVEDLFGPFREWDDVVATEDYQRRAAIVGELAGDIRIGPQSKPTPVPNRRAKRKAKKKRRR